MYGGYHLMKNQSQFNILQPRLATLHMPVDLQSSLSSYPPINYFGAPPPPPGGAPPPLLGGVPPPPPSGAPPPPPSCIPQLLENNVRSLPLSGQCRVLRKMGSPPLLNDNLFESVVSDGLDCRDLSKKNGARNSITPSSALSQLITLQSAEGFWTLDQSLASLIGCTLVELKSTCPAGCTEVMWATLLALAFLEKQFTSHRDEWELVAMKAEFWLQSQPLPSTVDSLKQIASQNLK